MHNPQIRNWTKCPLVAQRPAAPGGRAVVLACRLAGRKRPAKAHFVQFLPRSGRRANAAPPLPPLTGAPPQGALARALWRRA